MGDIRFEETVTVTARAPLLTAPRQVRLVKCAIFSPNLSSRATSKEDQSILQTYGFDLMPYIQKIDLYENITDNTISGAITMVENVGLAEYIPIVGVETVALAFQIDSHGTVKEFKHAFRVVALKDQAFPRHDYRMYTLQLVTPEFVTSISTRISRAFQNITCSTAVQQILMKDLGVKHPLITAETTNEKMTVVIPNYTPLRAINYFTMLAQTTKTPTESNFLFFETLDGFHFTSLRQLLSQKPVKSFSVNPGQITVAPTVKDSTVFNSIERVHQDQSFDLLKDIASGVLRSQMIHFDFLAKQIDFVDSRYTDTFDQTTHLDKYPVYPKNFDLTVGKSVRQFVVPSNSWTNSSPYLKGKDTGHVQRLHEAIMLRNRQLREIQHLQTLLDLPGQPDLRAGSVVSVMYPTTRHLEGRETSTNAPIPTTGTPYYSGNHLVTEIHHILSVTSPGSMDYRMHVKVCRDSFGAPLIGTSNQEGK